MSYARWSNNDDWYIYHDCHSDDSKGRDGQLLAIWHNRDTQSPMYYYPQIKNDRESIWNDITSRVYGEIKSREVFDECLDVFIENVERDYDQLNKKERKCNEC